MSDSLLITTDAFGTTEAITWSFSHATPVYAEMEVYLITASLTAWYADAGGGDISLGKLGFQFDFAGNQLLLHDSDAGGDYDSWFSFYDAAPVVAGTTEGWHTIRWSGTPDGGTLHLAADATDQTSTMPAYGIGNLTSARFGTVGVGVAGQTMYIGRCRVGTTLGGFDLLDYTPALDGAPGPYGFSIDGTIALSTAPTPPPSSSGGGGSPAVLGKIYATHGGFGTTDDNLYTVDPDSVALTTIGNTFHIFTGLAIDPTDLTLFGVTGNLGSTPRSLFSINALTGVATLIGALGSTVADICFDDLGQMYGWKPGGASGGANRLTLIDKATGTRTDRAASGLTSTAGCGLSFMSGVLYVAPKGADGNLYSVNTTSGAVTSIGTMIGVSGDNCSGMTTREGKLWGIGQTSGKVFTVGALGDTITLTVIGTLDTGDSGWDSIAAAPASPAPPPTPSYPSGVYIAFTSDTLSTSPDYVGVANVQSWETHRGRQYELDKTQAGTAIVTVVDEDGILDPTNSSSPFFGTIGPLSPAQIRAVNPVTQATFPIFTGFIESWTYSMDITEGWMIATINLTDGFEILSRAEVIPDGTGTTTFNAQQVNDRINAALSVANWPGAPEGRNIFFGNVDLQRTVYNPQTSILSVIQDAADAEFPNVANVFIDKWGRVAFRGRWARFNAEFYSPRPDGMTPPPNDNQVNFWHVGDRNAAQTHGYAPIADIQWNLDLKNVINACLCYPYGIAQSLISGQLRPVSFPTASTAKYGLRSFTIPDLIVANSLDNSGNATPGGDGPFQGSSTADEECQIFAAYYVANYARPVEMISSISFHSLDPADSLAGPLWHFITCVEIGDVVTVHTSDPGGGGFKATQFFVEGVHNVVTNDLRGDVLAWKMNLDLTPRMWYSKFKGVTYYP